MIKKAHNVPFAFYSFVQLLRIAVQQGGDALAVTLFQRFAAGGGHFEVAQTPS
ncbi:Uncharacterised protein [Ewingella americana]|uniref:Uncharacterized protein n=1 Tax=Ewingella americana TaxID=41202 RepID=A0A377NHN1_9GAMM|nr:Uncharacterised protein [Ewingella americana]